MNNKTLITGSLGQVGSYLSEHLLSQGYEIIGIDNELNKYASTPIIVKEKTIKDDICNSKTVNKIMKKVDNVVHCAAQISIEESIKDPIFDLTNNAIGTLTLLEAAKNNPIKRFIYISSAATYGEILQLPIKENHPQHPFSPYGISKFTGENYVTLYQKLYQLPTVVIRPFNIYSVRSDPQNPYSGVITKFIEKVKKNESIIIEGDGNQTRDFIHINDVIQMIQLSLEKKESIGQIFNCGTGKSTSINYLAQLIIKLSKKDIKLKYVNNRCCDIKNSYNDITKSKNLLKFSIKMDLEKGIKELLNN